MRDASTGGNHRDRPAGSNPARPWLDFKSHLRRRFGQAVYKLPIDAGFTCPNRDGRLGTGGCAYCDGRGSALRLAGPLPTVTRQLERQAARYRERHGASLYLPYFQTFTNTDAPVERLRAIYEEALSFPGAIGLAVGTRPDCLGNEVVALLASLLPRGEIWIELGVQSLHDETLRRVNRCHTVEASLSAIRRAAGAGLRVCAHLILGLPGETPEMMRETARRIALLPVAEVKLHSLLVIEGTPLAAAWRRGEVVLPSMAEYAGWAADVLEILPPGVVIQRLTADAPADVLLAPSWGAGKLAVIDLVARELDGRGTRQGSRHPAFPPPPAEATPSG